MAHRVIGIIAVSSVLSAYFCVRQIKFVTRKFLKKNASATVGQAGALVMRPCSGNCVGEPSNVHQ